MVTAVSAPDVEAALVRAEQAVAELVRLSLDGCADDDVLSIWQRVEVINRQLAAVDHQVIGQVEARHLPFVHGAKSTAVLARDALRIDAREAHARVHAAGACGSRTSMTGESLTPALAHVAAAQAAGDISPRHARIVVTTVEHLPDSVQDQAGDAIEAQLVGYATTVDPDALGKIARRLTSLLDPDGLLHEADYRDRHRELHVRTRSDGSSQLIGELTAEATEWLSSVLDSLAKPRPSGPTPAERDPRTPAQRRHDAVLELAKMAQRAALVPNAGGVTCTVVLTGTVTDWAAVTGTVTTGHGASIPTAEAQRWVGGDARFLGVLFDRMKRVEAYSSIQRLFTEQQRLAMAARDGGCTFPNCDAPPGQCEAHHMINYADGGPTSTGNGALMCSSNHRDHERMGWRGIMLDGVPAWIPPVWVDRDQEPRRNRLHDPVPDLQPV